MRYLHRCALFAIFLLGMQLYFLPAALGDFQDFLEDISKHFSSEKGLSEEDIVGGLKEALEIGTAKAVAVVSKTDGYFKTPAIKIPLPENISKTAGILRSTGFGYLVDDFERSMNRAAESAAPKAKTIFWSAIREMTFADARKILDGRQNEATLYFKDKTSGQLQKAFQPLVGQSLDEVGATRYYRQMNDRLESIPFADSISFDLNEYVTHKALDGLFFMLAKEEQKIREDPGARVTELLKKVFANES